MMPLAKRVVPVVLLALSFAAGARPQEPTWQEKQAAFEQEVRELIPEAMSLRGIYRTCDFGVRLVKFADLAPVLEEAVAGVPLPKLRAQEAVLKGLGLLPPDVDVLEVIVKQLPSQILGIYLPSRRELVVVDDPPPMEGPLAMADGPMARRMILLHELTHALQDCDEDLASVGELSDLSSALSSFYEGEATFVGMVGMLPRVAGQVPPIEGLAPGPMMKMAMAHPSVKDLPPLVRHGLVFPYLYGMAYYARERKRAGVPVRQPVQTLALFEGFGEAPALAEPVPPPGNFFMTFSLGASTFHFLFPGDFEDVLQDLRGEGVWVTPPAADGVWRWVWWLQAADEEAVQRLERQLTPRLAKGLNLHREGRMLRVGPGGKTLLPAPMAWTVPQGVPPDVAAVPDLYVPLPRNRWQLVQAEPLSKTLRHQRYPLLFSVTQFQDTPTLTHTPEAEVWLAQIASFCKTVVAARMLGDRFHATCVTAGGRSLRLHVRLVSFPGATVALVCTGPARRWQPGFEETCGALLRGAYAPEGQRQSLPLTPPPQLHGKSEDSLPKDRTP